MEKTPESAPVTPQSLVSDENVRKTLLADKGKDASLIDWKVVDFTKKGDNYATVVSSVEVKYSQDNQTNNVTYIVKLNPCRGFEQFEVFTEVIFKTEAGFYLELVNDLSSVLVEVGLEPLNFPKGFHADLEKKKQQLYLKDLRPLGFKMFDKRKGMDPPHVSLVLKELGKLHASSLLLEHKNKVDIVTKYEFVANDMFCFENEQTLGMMEGYITTAVDVLKKVTGYERAISWAESLRPNIKEILTTGQRSERFNVVIHGDCWNNNIIFKYNETGDPVQVSLLDLQGCRKVSCAIDLNYFFYTSLNGDVRKNNFDSFLSIYYNSFQTVMEAGGLKMPFTRDELTKEFRDKNVVGGYFGMMVIPFVLFEPEDVPDLTGNDEEFEQVMAELKAKTIQMVDKSPLMKPRYLSMFDEFMEIGLIP